MAILKVAFSATRSCERSRSPSPSDRSSRTPERLIDDMVETMREYNGARLAERGCTPSSRSA